MNNKNTKKNNNKKSVNKKQIVKQQAQQNDNRKKKLLAAILPITIIASAACIVTPVTMMVLNRNATIDKVNIKKINDILKEEATKPKTMFDLVKLLADKNIDIEGMNANGNSQYVWDMDKNIVFTMNQDGSIAIAPDGYELNTNKQRIWKMVTLGSTNGSIETFKNECEYGQYIRKDCPHTETIEIKTAIDTGYNKGYTISYTKPDDITLEVAPIINTNKAKLTINGSYRNVDHYGHASSLTIITMQPSAVYNEYGTVDADVIIQSPYGNKFVAQPSSTVNTIIIDDPSAQVEVIADGTSSADVGTIGRTEKVTPKEMENNVVVSKDVPEEKKPDVIKDEAQEIPTEKSRYAGGLGTKKSPFVIANKLHLEHCSEDVNADRAEGEEDKEFFFRLSDDIEMDNATFTTIGIDNNHAFRGIFDGNGHTIKNFTTVNNTVYSDCSYQGLFGITNGEVNTHYQSSSAVWDDEKNELIDENITEDKYTTVIKNLTIENITVNNVTLKDSGGLAGSINNTYICNVQIKSGTIGGYKNTGALAGEFNGSVCKNCTIGDVAKDAKPLKIVLNNNNKKNGGYNAGALIGNCGYAKNCYEAILDCNSCRNVTVDVESAIGGTIGGLIGVMQNGNLGIMSRCTNYANIVVHEDSAGVVNAMAGVLALAQKCYVLDQCYNYGNITTSGTKVQVNYLAGIATYGETLLYKCQNHGKISGYLPDYNEEDKFSMAGIFANTVKGSRTHELVLINCVNDGEIDSKNPKTKTYQLCDGVSDAVIDGETFANVEALNSRLIEYANNAMITIKNCTVTDTTGTLVIPSSTTTSLNIDKKICGNIDVGACTSLYVNMPNTTITINKETTCDLICAGNNSVVTIAENGKVNSAYVSGDNSELYNNGIINTTFGIVAGSTKGVNNGTCASVTFGENTLFGTGTKTFTNGVNGKVIMNATRANQHVLDAIGGTKAEIIVENYGEIKYYKDPSYTFATGYLACIYSTPDPYIRPKIKFYSGSTYETNVSGYFFATANETETFPGYKYALEYQEGAHIKLTDGEDIDFKKFENANVSVLKF